MKTIKIFLASSDELEVDRARFGNLVRRLDKIYEKRDIRIELIEWEDLDAAYNGQRKQDEYNQEIRESDLFLAVFHQKAGKFTLEEFNVATEEFKKHASPKVYAYMKDLAEDEQEQPELTVFKKRLFDEMGHYWCRYGNTDTMQLHFVMQLQLVESNRLSELKLEVENTQVKLDSMPVADLSQVPFTANNQQYIEWKENLAKVQDEIAAFESILATTPNETIEQLLGSKRTERYNLQDKLNDLEKSLLGTALTIVSLQGRASSDRLRRAIERFEAGDNMGANAIFDPKEIEADTRRNLENYRMGKQLTEEAQKAVCSNIEEYRLRAKNLLTIYSNENRFVEIEQCYDEAMRLAKEVEMNKEEYVDLLCEYGTFLRDYARYDKALTVYQELISMCEILYGLENQNTATSYNNIGFVYAIQGEYDKALEWYFKALAIREKVFGVEHPDTATSYNNIGFVYCSQGEYDKALEWHFKALVIEEKVLGVGHPDTATSYNNIGGVYNSQGEYDKALEWYFKALAIHEKVLGVEHPHTATSYNNIGGVYDRQGEYDKALEWYFKALAIREKVLGVEHPDTATSYNNIGHVYGIQGEYDKALEWYLKALVINEKILGVGHPHTAISYSNIRGVYNRQREYGKTLEWNFKASAIYENILGVEHPHTATSYCDIGGIYDSQGEYDKALEWNFKALVIREKVLGVEHPDTATNYNNIGSVYDSKGEYDEALKWYLKANIGSPNDVSLIRAIGDTYCDLNNLSKSIEWYQKGLEIDGNNNIILNNLAYTYNQMGEHQKAVEAAMKAIDIDSDFANPYRHVAIAYEAIDDMNKAIEYYTRSAELGNEKAKLWLKEHKQ